MSLPLPTFQPIRPDQIAAAGGALTLYGPDGKPLSPAAFHSPVDYGPGAPLVPRITERYAPREYQYPIGFNLTPSPRQESGKQLSFAALRSLVDVCPYARISIEYRKRQIRSLEWDVVPLDGETKSAREARKDDLDRALAFIREPNRIDRLSLSTWLGQAIEEILVTDALTFYRHRDNAGRLHSLRQIDGSTIKLLLDQWGCVVGYQQILYGYPTTQYSVGEEFAGDDMAYLVFNPRVAASYGTSPVEDIAPVINLAVRRLALQTSWYTEGNVPVGFIEAPETWSDTTIEGFQRYLDDAFSGNDAQRSRLRLLPHGANYKAAQPFQFNKDEEEAILAQVVAGFGVPKHLFTQSTNRATAQAQNDESQDTGLKPLLAFIGDFLTKVVNEDLGIAGVKVVPVSEMTGDALARAQAQVALVQVGILTVDEARAERGLDPAPPEPDPAPMPAPASTAPVPAPVDPKSDDRADLPPKAAAELATWRKWAMKRVEKGAHRVGFVVRDLPADVAAGIRYRLAKAETSADVWDAFDLEKRRKHDRAKSEKKLAGVMARWFAAERKRVEAMGREALKGNADA